MKKIKWLLVFSLAFNLFGIGALLYVSSKKGGLAYIIKSSIAQPSENVTPLRVGIFKTYDTQNKIVFLGDSITMNCEWAELLNRTDVVNRGVSAETTFGLLNRIDDLNQPSKVFIMIGINDLMKSTLVGDIFHNYKELITKLQMDSPKAKIYIQNTLPINYSKQGKKIENKDVEELNKLLSGIDGVTVINMSNLVDNGQLKGEYTEDGVHVNGQGYLKWKEVIAPYIAE